MIPNSKGNHIQRITSGSNHPRLCVFRDGHITTNGSPKYAAIALPALMAAWLTPAAYARYNNQSPTGTAIMRHGHSSIHRSSRSRTPSLPKSSIARNARPGQPTNTASDTECVLLQNATKAASVTSTPENAAPPDDRRYRFIHHDTTAILNFGLYGIAPGPLPLYDCLSRGSPVGRARPLKGRLRRSN